MEISVLTGLLSLISELAVSTDEILCFCKKKSQADFAKNNCIRKSFLLQATFIWDIVAQVFQNHYFFPKILYACILSNLERGLLPQTS